MAERLAETVWQLEEITQIQSDVINSLFALLLQHISSDCHELKHITDKINHAAEIRHEVQI